ncbi:MAG: nucleotidyltransferase substrate binding protein [Treponema sp.]|jgi:nucleotidyltransferase substrate binding protein (TIGR01987 family)|nr:nucleotidyltransferase substrate binding protein [Treponema sp.]
MEKKEDIRWKQRLQNYKKALGTLEKAAALEKTRELTDLEKQGTIQSFEFTLEMAWNVMKDYLEEQGLTGIIGSKGAVRQAFSKGLIEDGQVWMDMIESRNISSHSYDEAIAEKLLDNIFHAFYRQLKAFEKKMCGIE